MKIGIFGVGAFGLALSSIVSDNDCEITMWSKFEEEIESLRTKKENEKLLPGYHIKENIKLTNKIEECMREKELLIIAIPVPFIEDLLIEMKPYIKNHHIVIASKGITKENLVPTELLEKHIKTKNYAVIGGPTFATDIITKKPIAFTLATKNITTKHLVISALKNNYVKLECIKDVIGTELCGALKNVYAIIAGILSSIKATDSTKALFYSEALYDLKKILKSLGGEENTTLTYAGIGDFLLTCSSTSSRNYSYGKLLGQEKKKEVRDEYLKNTTVEGYHTLKSLITIMEKEKLSLPLIEELDKIINKKKNPKKILEILLTK